MKLEAFWNAKACRPVNNYRHSEAGTTERRQQFTSPYGLTFQKHWLFNQYVITHFFTMLWAFMEREFLRHYPRSVSVLRIPLCMIDFNIIPVLLIFWFEVAFLLYNFRRRNWTYTGCNRRNGPDFGRVFLTLNYTEKPQNTYIRSSMVTEI